MKKTNRLGSILDRLLTSKNLSLHQAGALLKMHHTVLSTVTRGASHLSRRNLQILLGQIVKCAAQLDLSETEAEELAVGMHRAWLEEQILPEYEADVAVVRRGRATSLQPLEPRSVAIAFFDEMSKRSPSVAQWLVATHSVMKQSMLDEADNRKQAARPQKKSKPA